MAIGLFDVEVGQIQCASWDVFSSFTPLNLPEISAFLINIILDRLWSVGAQGFVLLAPSLLAQTYLFASFGTSEAVKLYQKPISFWSYSALFFISIKYVSAGDLIKLIKKINAENCS